MIFVVRRSGPKDAPIKLSTTVRILDQHHSDKVNGD